MHTPIVPRSRLGTIFCACDVLVSSLVFVLVSVLVFGWRFAVVWAFGCAHARAVAATEGDM